MAKAPGEAGRTAVSRPSVLSLFAALALTSAALYPVGLAGATAGPGEVKAARIVGFDDVVGHSLRVVVDAGYCADSAVPRLTIDHSQVVERRKSARWPKGSVEVTVFTDREVVPEEGPTCIPFGGTLSRKIVLRRPAAGLPIFDASSRPPRRVPAVEEGRGPNAAAR